MTPEEFYALVGDLFDATADRPHPHRGVDFPWDAGTPIPTWCDGVVVANFWHDVLGWVIVIATSGGWAGHCHMLSQSPLPVGTKVNYGDIIGTVGATGEVTGPHDHATFSTVGDSPATSPVVDPLPWIRSAMRGVAEARALNAQKGKQMKLMLVSGEDKYTAVADDGWFDLPKMPQVPDGSGGVKQGPLQTAVLKLWGPVVLWDATERAELKKVLPQRKTPTVVSGSVPAGVALASDVVAATAAVVKKIEGLEIPTSIQNGKAARDAIVKS